MTSTNPTGRYCHDRGEVHEFDDGGASEGVIRVNAARHCSRCPMVSLDYDEAEEEEEETKEDETEETLEPTIERLAATILRQTREDQARRYPSSPETTTVNVKPGKLYTKIDVGPFHNMSGKYMVEHATGVIFGIKGYGQVHKGHTYGTLATIDEWFWGGYQAVPVAS